MLWRKNAYTSLLGIEIIIAIHESSKVFTQEN